MSVFTVSFKIKDNDTYQKRYDSFVKEIQKGNYWAETTSFIVVETTESIDDFCHRIYVKTDFNASWDIFVVLDSQAKSGRAKGDISDLSALQKLIPYLKKA